MNIPNLAYSPKSKQFKSNKEKKNISCNIIHNL